MAAKIASFNSVNSEITGRKLTKFGKKSTEPSSVHKGLSYGEKFAKIGPVYPEIFHKIRQFLAVLYLTFTNDLVVMATSLDKWENKLLFRHRHLKRFHTVKRLRKSVQ